MTMQDILDLRHSISIAHHIPGRLRLKFSLRLLSHPALKSLSGLKLDKKDVKGLLDARLNLVARSLLLEYDPNIISPELLTDFLTTKDEEHARKLAKELADFFGLRLDPEPPVSEQA